MRTSAEYRQEADGGILEFPYPVLAEIGQWTSGGVDQLKPHGKVVWVSSDRTHLRVYGNMTGIPMAEVTVLEGAKPPKAAVIGTATETDRAESVQPEARQKDISVFLTGNRLEITATVDSKTLPVLKQMLDKYEEILKLMQ